MSERRKIEEWFLREIIQENLFHFLAAFVDWTECHEELEKKVKDLIDFVIEHLKED
ncbi:MAG: hypothetical protein ACP6IS_11115 [Candidatus Asgardarchaeia archaeon]